METLIWIIAATLLNGFVAFSGAFTLFMREKLLEKLITILVAFSAGALLAGAFFHLLAESVEKMEFQTALYLLFSGFILFFLIEKILKWHHCHKENCKYHPFTYLILFGDGIHNFIDGLIIAASFMIDINFGIITTLIIIGHEIPQELGNFGVLVHGGISKIRALFYNFLAQLTAVFGGIVGYFFGSSLGLTDFLLPFAAGGFIYIAASDLVPELKTETDLKKSIITFLFFLVGIALMILLKSFAE